MRKLDEYLSSAVVDSANNIAHNRMGPTTNLHEDPAASGKVAERPRRSSLPELKSADKATADKKVPTGPRANPLYKTRLCMNYQSTGSCPYTDKCQFAHGVKELEKWEAWRNAHKGDEPKQEVHPLDANIMLGRPRSQSFEKSRLTPSLDGSDFGSPLSGPSYEFSTPIMSSVSSVLDETPTRLEFSLWSSKLDNLDTDQPFRPELRGRAATYDSTYDNMSQLRDAPTLFPSPPILPNLGRLSFPQ